MDNHQGNAARGIVIGAAIGGIMWATLMVAVIVWMVAKH